ncbi:MAG: hypothetical protein Q8J70_11790 [Thiobacillus sp.]|nr:hypothetical protein [Thiobacillus sp.]
MTNELVTTDPLALQKPIWEEWESAKTAKLWHAVALACDLDPNNFGFFYLDKLRSSLGPSYPAVFANLLKLAINNLGPNGLLGPANMENLEDTEIELPKFAAWLKTIGHRPPEKFPWIPDKMQSGNHVWPWGKYETNLLATLALAADKFWGNYDPNNSTPPKQLEVVGWLLKNGAPSNNIAEAIATILRADGLPTRSKRK